MIKTNQFFDDIKYILKEPVKVGQRTNVIYLNTNCNLACDYCYEKESKNKLSKQICCTTNDIDKFLIEIINREQGCISTIVIMGGEPFLKFNLIEYVVAKCLNLIRRTSHKGFGLSVISNGTLFTENRLSKFKYLQHFAGKNKVNLSLEISYDASGQFKRSFPDGKSSKEIVEQTLLDLEKWEIPFKISYTVHQGNYNKIIEDLIYIFEALNSGMLQRITVGLAYSDLKGININVNSFKEQLKVKAQSLFKIYGIPICGLVCEKCGICKKSNFTGNSYLSPVTGISFDEKQTKHDFNQFKE